MRYITSLGNGFKRVWSKDFLFVFLYDLIFVGLVYYLFNLFVRTLQAEALRLREVGLSMSDPASIALTREVLSSFWNSVTFNAALTLFLFFIVWVVMRVLVWTRIQKQPFTKKLYLLPAASLIFMVLALLWSYILWIAIDAQYMPYAAVITFILILHFSWINGYAFMKSYKIKDTIHDTFVMGIKSIPKLIIPYVIILTAIMILLRLPSTGVFSNLVYTALLLAFSKMFLAGFLRDAA